MISVSFEERAGIGLNYILDNLHGCSPFGLERIRHLRFYAPDERALLEAELDNTEKAASSVAGSKDVLEKIAVELCRLKDIRPSLKRLREGDCLDAVELFELKGYLERIGALIPLLAEWNAAAKLDGIALHDPSAAIGVLDPERTRSRGFYIPDSASEGLRAVRRAKKAVEERLYRAQSDAERTDLKLERTRICADEEAEEPEETDSETETAPDDESGESPAEGGSPERMTLPPVAIALAVAIVAIIVAVAVMTAGVGMSSGRNVEASFPKAHAVAHGSGEATDDIHGKTQTPTHQNDPNFG